jgi:CBS domain-containing protein
MTAEPKTLGADMSAADAAGLMASFDIGVVPVMGPNDDLIGLVTDRDLVVRVIAGRKEARSVRLADIATKSVIAVTPDMRLSEARNLMAKHQVRRLPVLKAGRLVGIVSLGDVALADPSERAVGVALEEVSESESTASQGPGGPDRGTPDRARRDGD